MELFLRILTITLFLNWNIYWWFIAPRAKQSDKQSNVDALSKWANLLLCGFILLQLLGLRVVSFHSLVAAIIGIVLVIGGILWSVAARIQLGTNWVPGWRATIVKGQPLLTTGAYSLVRHPIYIGCLLIYIGCELVAQSWLFISMFFLLIHLYQQAKQEETILIKHFGEQYKKYMSQTKMLIPWIF